MNLEKEKKKITPPIAAKDFATRPSIYKCIQKVKSNSLRPEVILAPLGLTNASSKKVSVFRGILYICTMKRAIPHAMIFALHSVEKRFVHFAVVN